MKYPNQQEVYYLRHILLDWPKRSFTDCLLHSGKCHATYEAVLTKIGYFASKDESDRVLMEMKSLHYTAAQLRFAFLLLIHDDAKPHLLYERHANLLMKDFLDRGITKPDAAHMLRRELLPGWMALGYP